MNTRPSDTQPHSWTPRSLSWKRHRNRQRIAKAALPSRETVCITGKSSKCRGSHSDRASRAMGVPHLSETPPRMLLELPQAQVPTWLWRGLRETGTNYPSAVQRYRLHLFPLRNQTGQLSVLIPPDNHNLSCLLLPPFSQSQLLLPLSHTHTQIFFFLQVLNFD